MIIGAHAIVYTRDADGARAFFRDVLGMPSVDAGHGWLIFALPPAEVAAHPAEGGDDDLHRLYLMCDDLPATMRDLESRGATFSGEVSKQPWGDLVTMNVPGGATIGLYQPRHPIAIKVGARGAGSSRPKRSASRQKKKAPTKKAPTKKAKRRR